MSASRRRVTVELTVAQLRLVNGALAVVEAGDSGEDYVRPVMERTRAKVWAAFDQLGVEP